MKSCQVYFCSSKGGRLACYVEPTFQRECCADIRKIIPAGILPDSLAGGIARVSNLKNAKVVTSPSGKKVFMLTRGSRPCTFGHLELTGCVPFFSSGGAVSGRRGRRYPLLGLAHGHGLQGGPPRAGTPTILPNFAISFLVAWLTAFPPSGRADHDRVCSQSLR
jgi:hypothetical protein